MGRSASATFSRTKIFNMALDSNIICYMIRFLFRDNVDLFDLTNLETDNY